MSSRINRGNDNQRIEDVPPEPDEVERQRVYTPRLEQARKAGGSRVRCDVRTASSGLGSGAFK